MNDTWFEPDVSPQDIRGFMQALSLRDEQNAPLLAVTSGPQGEARLVLASRPLFGLFGVTNPADLSARLLRGDDPGAKRLTVLFQMLPLEGAPRLERLRFFLGPGSEIITFLCRRMAIRGRPMFLAAALGVRAGLIAAVTSEKAVLAEKPLSDAVDQTGSGAKAGEQTPPAAVVSNDPHGSDPEAGATLPEHAPDQTEPMEEHKHAAAVAACFRERWPSTRTLRFLWRTDATAICTMIGPPLAEVTGPRAANLAGRDLGEIAPALDPSGRLARHLTARDSWSGLDVPWPIDDAAATVMVTLGAIPALTPDKSFDGFRGFGVIHLDRVAETKPVVFPPPLGATTVEAANPVSNEPDADAVEPGPPAPAPVKTLSSDDRVAFEQIGDALREDAAPETVAHGDPAPSDATPESLMAEIPPHEQQLVTEDEPIAPAAVPPCVEGPLVQEASHRAPEPPATPVVPHSTRGQDIGRNGLAILDKLNLGLLVSRNNVPIFANRHLLDVLGFADEDALHEAGGMTHLFGGLPGNVTGSEAVGIRGRDGSVLAVNARMQVIEWDGLPATLLTLKQNGGLGKTEAEAKRAQDGEMRELRAILETATDGVAVLDADCNVLSLNRSGEALFGCDRSEVIGKPFLTLFAPHNQSLASDYFEGLKSSATKSLLNDGREFLIKAHQGGTIPVFMTLGKLGSSGSAPASGEAPNDARFCALFRDLTHWKKVEQELDHARQSAERTSALKSDFLAKVSHEIRTPLNAIIGFAEVIMDERFGPVGNDRYKDYLKDIHNSGTHVMSLVNDLLDLSKIEAGKMELNPVPIDANKIITDCVSTMHPQASHERVIMRLSLAPTLPRIKADERSLRQIVLNLLSNAVKFNEPGGQVIISTALTDAGHVVMRIRDTGPGMSDQDIETALEPFRQLSTSRPMTVGTGLGLPLTKALVEANHASFTIRSKVEQGTLVEVAFPPALVLAD